LPSTEELKAHVLNQADLAQKEG